MQLRISMVVLLALVCSCGGDDASAQEQWYELPPLLESLKPNEARSAHTSSGVSDLSALVLHDLKVNINKNEKTFTVDQEIFFTNTYGSPLSEVPLRLFANSTGDRIQLKKSECVGRPCQVGWDGKSTIRIKFKKALAPDEKVRFKLGLLGTFKQIAAGSTNMMSQAMSGMSRLHGGSSSGGGDYGLISAGDGILSLGNFYAVVAARKSGKWVLSEGSTMGDLGTAGLVHFKAYVKVPPQFQVATTGVTVREQTVLGKGSRPRFTEVYAVAGMARDFCIMASSRLVSKEKVVDGTTIRSWYLSGHEAKGDLVLETAAKSLKTFETHFGSYPYKDLDLVEAPLVGGAGGVEFTGLVTVASMFYKPIGGPLGGMLGGGGGLSKMTDAMLEFVTAHEVAHQWWHGIVASDSREHPFVDESLAQFSAVLYMEKNRGKKRAALEARRQVASNYHMMRQQGTADAAVDQPVSSFSNEMQYAGIVYGKGPFMYPELRKTLGEKAFFDGMRRYVRQNKFKKAAPDALIKILISKTKRKIKVRSIAKRWLQESHGDDDLGTVDQAAIMKDWFPQGATKGMLGGMLRQLGGTGGLQKALEGLGGLGGLGGIPGQTIGPGGQAQDMDKALEEAAKALSGM